MKEIIRLMSVAFAALILSVCAVSAQDAQTRRLVDQQMRGNLHPHHTNQETVAAPATMPTHASTSVRESAGPTRWVGPKGPWVDHVFAWMQAPLVDDPKGRAHTYKVGFTDLELEVVYENDLTKTLCYNKLPADCAFAIRAFLDGPDPKIRRANCKFALAIFRNMGETPLPNFNLPVKTAGGRMTRLVAKFTLAETTEGRGFLSSKIPLNRSANDRSLRMPVHRSLFDYSSDPSITWKVEDERGEVPLFGQPRGVDMPNAMVSIRQNRALGQENRLKGNHGGILYVVRVPPDRCVGSH